MTEEKSGPLLHISASPHIVQKGNISSIMLSMVIALIPALIGSIFFFGFRSLLLACTCIAAAVGSEWLVTRLAKEPATVCNYSAVVTALLLAFSLPPNFPLWMAFLGGVFAIIVAKMAFGGLGKNFINPALAGRCFLMISFPAAMTTWSAPLQGSIHGLTNGLDGVSAATPIAYFNSALASGNFHPLDFQEALPHLFLGSIGGCTGETSALLLLAGAFFLWYKRIIGFGIPLFFIGTLFSLFWIFNGTGGFLTSEAFIIPFYQILSGGLFLGALFMANDPVTTPITPLGRIVFGAGCGVLTFIFRVFGNTGEGVCYAILLMNCCSPLIEQCTRPRRYGEVRKSE